MKASKLIVKLIGWIFVITGFIMRFTDTSFSGTFLSRNRGWTNSTMTGTTVIFFGLVFLVIIYWPAKRKE